MADERSTDAARVAAADAQERVQLAVEAFVAQRSRGEKPEPAAFADDYEEELRSAIVAQCREFLAFDGMLGAQEWSDHGAEAVTGDEEGRRFGDFDILEELGRGGNGVVYLARQRSLDRRVALKVMVSGLSYSKRHVERFRREATATAQLRHPAIVPVHSFFEVDGTFGLAMDYIAGRTLAELLGDLALRNQAQTGGVEGTLGIAPDKGYVAECALLAAEVASALGAAHDAKIVHRDLKPQNLMIDDRQQVRLLDFGLAKSLEPTAAALSRSGELNGTLHYVSPEQTLANRVVIDQRTDVWSLGVILYELLTLTRPFEGRDKEQVYAAICLKEPVPTQRRNPKVPRDLDTICSKALEKDPHRRYQSAAEFEADLRRFLNWEPIHARPVGALGRAAKWARRHRVAAAIASALLLATAATLGVVSYQRAADARRAAALMASAAESADAGDYAQAIASTNDALTFRNDEVTRERLGRYHAESKRVENEAARRVAESARVLRFDPAGALQLALHAHRIRPSSGTRTAALAALSGGVAARELPLEGRAATRSVAWSPSGALFAVAGRDGALRVFSAAGDRAPWRLSGHRADVTAVAFLDEKRLISLGMGEDVKIWRVWTGEVEASLALGEAAAYSLQLDPARRRVLVVMQDRASRRFGARAFDARTGDPAGPFVAQGNLPFGATVAPDGELAAAWANGLKVRVWRTADGAPVLDQAAPFARADKEIDNNISAFAFAPDGAAVAIGSPAGEVAVLRVADGAVLGKGRHTGRVTALAFAPDGDRLLSGSRDFTARIWSFDRSGAADTLTEQCTLGGDHHAVHAVAFDESGALAATVTGADNSVLRVFDCRGAGPQRALFEQRVGSRVRSLAFLPGDRALIARAKRAGVVWNFLQQRGGTSLQQPGKVQSVAFLDRDQRLVSSGDDERLRVWSRREGRLIWQTKPLGDPIKALATDRDGGRVAAALVDGSLRVHAADDGRALRTLPGQGDEVQLLDFLSEDVLLTVGADAPGQRGVIATWSLDGGARLRQAQQDGPVEHAAVSADHARLATVARGADRVQVWALPTLEPLATVGAGGGDVRAVTFHPATADLLVCREDGRAERFDARGERTTTLRLEEPPRSVTYSHDGRFLLACYTAGLAQLLRAADGAEELRFDLDGTLPFCGALTADGRWAATSYRSGAIRIWPTDPVAAAQAERSATAAPLDGR
ncbi:MAG: WD40 repeat domain-containing serine/threonine-protein kinase [Planctomycetota bacterium]